MLCDYECGNTAIIQFKNGKWCCNNHCGRCPKHRERMKESNKTYMTSERRKWFSDQAKERYKNNPYTEIQRKASSESTKERIRKNPSLHPNAALKRNKGNLSYPERLAYTFFENNKIKFESQFYVVQYGYWCDFLINDTLIIEVDGEYFHNLPKRIEYDAKRESEITSLGYKVIRLPAKNILNNLHSIFANTDISKIDVEKVKQRIIRSNQYKNIRINKNSFIRDKLFHVKIKKNRSYKITKEDLENIIFIYSFVKIGEIFGVSDNAIKKRAMSLGISMPSRNSGWEKNRLTKDVLWLYNEEYSISHISLTVEQPISVVKNIIILYNRKNRPNKIDVDKIIYLYKIGYKKKKIAEECSCNRSTVYEYIKKYNLGV